MLIRMDKLQNTDTFMSGEAVEQPQELGSTAGENATRYSHRGGQLAVSYKTKLLLAYDPAIISLVFIQLNGMCMSTQNPAHRCLKQL